MSTTDTAASNEASTDTAPDAQAQTQPGGDDRGEQKPEMSIEDYKSALEKARREAAKYRTERNELRPLADKAREAEEASKSDLQKAQERIAALEAEKHASIVAATRAEVASKHGVPVELVTGDDEEAMVASAAALESFVEQRLANQVKPHLPHVSAVGRDSGRGVDRDAQARQILGL